MDLDFKSFLLGIYICGAVIVFIVSMLFCVLGGDSKDLWKPFPVAIGWPIIFGLFLIGMAKGIKRWKIMG